MRDDVLAAAAASRRRAAPATAAGRRRYGGGGQPVSDLAASTLDPEGEGQREWSWRRRGGGVGRLLGEAGSRQVEEAVNPAYAESGRLHARREEAGHKELGEASGVGGGRQKVLVEVAGGEAEKEDGRRGAAGAVSLRHGFRQVWLKGLMPSANKPLTGKGEIGASAETVQTMWYDDVELAKLVELPQLSPSALVRIAIFDWACRTSGFEPNAELFGAIFFATVNSKTAGSELAKALRCRRRAIAPNRRPKIAVDGTMEARFVLLRKKASRAEASAAEESRRFSREMAKTTESARTACQTLRLALTDMGAKTQQAGGSVSDCATAYGDCCARVSAAFTMGLLQQFGCEHIAEFPKYTKGDWEISAQDISPALRAWRKQFWQKDGSSAAKARLLEQLAKAEAADLCLEEGATAGGGGGDAQNHQEV
uniref:Uncharacterized protein n=1 Tax=Oryza sativa subsp. japonica TaxID=39947 RepID=Q5WMN8_ORYSJ|nr:hypothetical protein [Oryza sativa Japonica Group]AAV32192.1 hypothetical protein [Oryza sativa Japonica Group]